MLVTVTEFVIEIEQFKRQDKGMMHGNKHLVIERVTGQRKRFQEVKLWKINVFNIFTGKNYDAVISYEDLITYYESEVFKFYEDRPNMTKPNLLMLLQDYIRNLYIYRTKVGSILYWKLPMYKRPMDENGQF